MDIPEFISRMPSPQRKILVNHVHGPMPFNRSCVEYRAISALIRADLLQGLPYGSLRPHSTSLTEKGRACVANLLASYAEALIRSGCLQVDENTANEMTPARMLQRIKSARSASGPFPNRSEEVAEPEEKLEVRDLGLG